jgi:hypothetical protein
VDEDGHGSDQSTAGLSAERIARNDAIFRHANESIGAAAEAEEIEDRVPFVCECADPACRELVPMTTEEYREVRQDARWFLNVPGHEASAQGWAQVVRRHDHYLVVEKIGPAGAVAEQLEGHPDPARANVDVDRGNRRDDPV